ncbi:MULTISPECIES: hypothetical protein [unclassified Arcicella]|uniref:hypothetical protein n=1 Tax=unclassified Arcicella TaxID=2644986 RepID=UPI0028585B37|nr:MULTISPECIES: hypothetical protein [unclassified Arcicella]MDR6562585.1 hypothetical protein [Arcicella sp. BE51]MDR6812672.1 hypothetical protein [Arcicella sp. BE140]MDR6823984.1 hypothetical protein [Arcicella sp. BE139]
MKISTITTTLLGCLTLLTACNDSKNASNAVFDKFAPTTKEYKNELASIVKSNPDELHYIFNKFIEKDGKEYLDIQIKGEAFEATGLVLVNSWIKLEEIKSTNGLGYAGAELKGLELVVVPSPSGADLVYKDLEEIVD